MKGLKGKVAVVAGGTGGIGTAISTRLAAEGASVVVGALSEDEAQDVARTITTDGGAAVGMGYDATDERSVGALFSTAVDHFGGVDLLSANAADISINSLDKDILDTPLDLFDRTISVNLRGYILLSRAALPLMLRRGGGAIVYTSSEASFIGTPVNSYYATSKGGVNALVRHVAARWGKEGIRSNGVSPGLILTPSAYEHQTKEFIANQLAAVYTPRLGVADDIASVVAMLLSEESGYLQGQVISVNGGLLMR